MALPARVHTTVRFRDDTRAQSVQIGAILLFATLVIALSLYQATVVPSQNADVEYKHSQTVQNQMTDVRNGILRSAATGNAQPASVTLGTQYPSRVFLMNPPPATGTLRTGSYENNTIRVSNIDATNPETKDFLNGSWTASTKYLEYVPDYNEYDNAPNLLYETSILSNFYPNTNDGTAIPLTDQMLVDNETRTITLVTLNGSLSTSRASSVTVSPETLSAPYQRVQVTNNSSGPVNVSVPTRLSASQLENRTDLGSHPGVIDVVDVPNEDRVVVRVDWTDQFILQTARVGVGSGTENPSAHYLTLVENRGDRVTVEARDRFNNAESGVNVSVNDTLGSDPFYESSKQTNENGQATFEVQQPGQRDATLEIGGAVYEQVSVTVQRTGSGGGGDGGGGGGGGEEPPAVQNGIRYDGNLGTTESNSAVEFDITNVDSQEKRINSVQLMSNIPEANKIWNTGSPGQFGDEVNISDGQNDGYAEAGNPQNANPRDDAFLADGGTITMSSNAVSGTGGGSESATVFVGQFGQTAGGSTNFKQYDFNGLARVSASEDWDVSITLRFQSNDPVTYYFQET